MMELGRVDISTEASILSSHMVLQHQGYLKEALHIMLYLSLHHNFRSCLDPAYPNIDITQVQVLDWSIYYGDVEEPNPPNASELIGHVCL